MLEIYVIRHGRTEFNEKDLIMGQIDSPLLPSSIKLSKKIGDKLKNKKFDVIFSSPIGRALVTAEIILPKLKDKPKLILNKKLKEINYGVFSGKSKKEISKRYPKYHKDASYVNPKGESFNMVYNRVIKFLLKQEKKYDRILVVTHAGCIRAIYSFFKNKRIDEVLSMNIKNDIIMKCILSRGKPIKVDIIQN